MAECKENADWILSLKPFRTYVCLDGQVQQPKHTFHVYYRNNSPCDVTIYASSLEEISLLEHDDLKGWWGGMSVAPKEEDIPPLPVEMKEYGDAIRARFELFFAEERKETGRQSDRYRPSIKAIIYEGNIGEAQITEIIPLGLPGDETRMFSIANYTCNFDVNGKLAVSQSGHGIFFLEAPSNHFCKKQLKVLDVALPTEEDGKHLLLVMGKCREAWTQLERAVQSQQEDALPRLLERQGTDIVPATLKQKIHFTFVAYFRFSDGPGNRGGCTVKVEFPCQGYVESTHVQDIRDPETKEVLISVSYRVRDVVEVTFLEHATDEQHTMTIAWKCKEVKDPVNGRKAFVGHVQHDVVSNSQWEELERAKQSWWSYFFKPKVRLDRNTDIHFAHSNVDIYLHPRLSFFDYNC